MDASVELVKRLLPSVVYIHTEVAPSHPTTADDGQPNRIIHALRV